MKKLMLIVLLSLVVAVYCRTENSFYSLPLCEIDGNVAVDSFPFFAYDSKTNGFSKTSLCWRLFRNEYDPKKDKRKVDVLFVPVWR